MKNFNVKGDIQAGRDNIFNIQNENSSKTIDQMSSEELQENIANSYHISKNYKANLRSKSKIYFLPLTIGIAALIFCLLSLKNLFISYSDGEKVNVKVLLNFFQWQINHGSPAEFLIYTFGVIILIFLLIVIPATVIWKLIFKDDTLLKEEKKFREDAKKRLRRLENAKKR